MEAESLGGRLLVATPLLGEPNFRRTVILIVEDEPEEGTLGVVGWRSLDGSSLMSRIGLVDLEAPPELLAGGITSLRVFAGYAGWGPGQLRAEIEEGAWYVLPGEPTDAFLAEPERLWPEVLRRQGGEFAIVATYPDDPMLN